MKPEIRFVTQDHDDYAPLAMGDVAVEAIRLIHERQTKPGPPSVLERVINDPTVHAGEISFSRHLIRLANGDRSIVGIPIFIARMFMHRGFYIRRGSPLDQISQLRGKRIGTSAWPATGNTWGRAALRDAGVRTQDCRWWVGPVDGHDPPPRDPLPPNAQFLTAGRNLVEMLRRDELDAILTATHPRDFYEPQNEIVRLLPNYPDHERDYYLRTRIFPPGHIIGIKRNVFEQYPFVARVLFDAVNESKTRWDARRRVHGLSSPWMLADLEHARALMGPDWRPYGLEPNKHMIEALCREELEQGLIATPVEPNTVFREFELELAKLRP
jgi:4,5-dihydroxyphthalate decarboxylase